MLEEPIDPSRRVGSGSNEMLYAVREGTEYGCSPATGGVAAGQLADPPRETRGHLLCAECGGETIPDGACAVCLNCAASSCGL